MKKLILVFALVLMTGALFAQQVKINKTFVVADRSTAFGEEVKINDFVYVKSDSNLYISKVALGRDATATYLLASPARYTLVNSGGSTFTTGNFTDDVTMDSTLAVAGAVSGAAATFTTVNTGQGAYELYSMNQDVESTDAVTFATVNTGQGANELYDMDQNVMTTSGVVFATSRTATATITTALIIDDEQITRKDANGILVGNSITAGDTMFSAVGVVTGSLASATLNTGNGAYELYSMNQDVESTDAVTFATVNTGQGANELYDMDQNVLTTSAVTFTRIQLTATDTTGVGSTATLGTIMFHTDGALYVNAGTTTPTWTALH